MKMYNLQINCFRPKLLKYYQTKINCYQKKQQVRNGKTIAMSYIHKKIKSSKIISSFQICSRWYIISCDQNQFFLFVPKNNMPL